MAAIKSEIYFRVCFVTAFVYEGLSICIPNFDEIHVTQSTAKIKLLSVSEKRLPPYWNCNSGFDYLFIVIGKSFCISLSNFVVIGLSAAKLWRHIDFSRWRHGVRNLLPSSGSLKTNSTQSLVVAMVRSSSLVN